MSMHFRISAKRVLLLRISWAQWGKKNWFENPIWREKNKQSIKDGCHKGVQKCPYCALSHNCFMYPWTLCKAYCRSVIYWMQMVHRHIRCMHLIPFLSPLTFTWMTRMLRPVSRDSCSLMCLVGFGVAANAAFRVSSCLAFMVVLGPRRFPTALCSSFSLLHTSLSDRCPVSESFPSSWGSWESGDRLGSLHVVTTMRIILISTRRLIFTESKSFAQNLPECSGIIKGIYYYLNTFSPSEICNIL